MSRFIFIRVIGLFFTLFFLTLAVFLMMHSIPGGPFDLEGGERGMPMPEAVRKEILKQAGLDKPVPIQYINYVWKAMHLDFGQSFARPNETVIQLIGRTWLESFKLGMVVFTLALVVGLLLGIYAALNQNTPIDYVTTSMAVGGTVFPNFVVAVVLVVIFGVLLKWLPTSGWEGPKYWIMPVIAFSLLPMSQIARYTRSSMIEVLGEDYVRTAHAKGLSGRSVVIRHCLKNALIPIITILGPIFADVITGSFYIETIFRIPGLGSFFTSSIFNRDYTMIMGTTILLAMLLSVVNLITDILYAYIDPRIQYGN